MLKTFTLFYFLFYQALLWSQPFVQEFSTNSTASFRGLFAISEKVCWASGTAGTVLKTEDGGMTWNNVSPQGFDTLQFRDIHAFDANRAFILSAGLPAVILKTTNGGRNWRTVYFNDSAGVFFDAIDFWDKSNGIAFSDARQTELLIIQTIDSGETWLRIPPVHVPPVDSFQGGFAASGTCLQTFGKKSAIIGLGGTSASTLTTNNRGKSWVKGNTPIDFGTPSKGIFSFHFIDTAQGYCVGGDYLGDSLSTNTIAKTSDGGKTWVMVDDENVSGFYLSCIKYIDTQKIVACSRTGISYTSDAGVSWKRLKGSYYTISVANNTVWLSGSNGKLGQLRF
jgi:photosystem II stability/assembly factor-like uncharacterized protein